MVEVMRTFNAALGVRCSACHVEEDDASDAKELKLIARAMMCMSTAVNDTYLAALPDREEPALRVTCVTCHRGVTSPEPIEALMRQTFEESGVDAALQRYGELRERYYGGFAYDFTDRPLVALADGLAEGNPQAARRVLEASLEIQPGNAQAQRRLRELTGGA
jgi:hypothetical protein